MIEPSPPAPSSRGKSAARVAYTRYMSAAGLPPRGRGKASPRIFGIIAGCRKRTIRSGSRCSPQASARRSRAREAVARGGVAVG